MSSNKLRNTRGGVTIKITIFCFLFITKSLQKYSMAMIFDPIRRALRIILQK